MPEANTTYTPFHIAVPPAAQPAVFPLGEQRQMAADQDLVQLCGQHTANKSALDACPLDADESPHWPPYSATSEAISAARPNTFAELAAKARAAKREALTPSGQEDTRNGSALDWAWDLVNDLIRLDEAA